MRWPWSKLRRPDETAYMRLCRLEGELEQLKWSIINLASCPRGWHERAVTLAGEIKALEAYLETDMGDDGK